MRKNFKLIINSYGQGKPVLTVVGSVHGNEILGEKIIDQIQKYDIVKGTLVTIIANPLAMQENKRFIDCDLNRCFPGNPQGRVEEKIAFTITKQIRNSDYLLDIHSTNATTDNMALIKKTNQGVKKLIHLIDIPNIIYIDKKHGNKSLIEQTKAGICFEFGNPHALKTYTLAVKQVKSILSGLGMIEDMTVARERRQKNFYHLFENQEKPNDFTLNRNIKNFRLVKKGSIIGYAGKEHQSVYAKEDFYPMLFGENSYAEIMGFKLKKISNPFTTK